MIQLLHNRVLNTEHSVDSLPTTIGRTRVAVQNMFTLSKCNVCTCGWICEAWLKGSLEIVPFDVISSTSLLPLHS